MNKLIIAVVVLSVLLVILLFKKSYFSAAAVSPYTSITLKLGVTPPSYIGKQFTNYSALITNVDPVAGCPPQIPYGEPLPVLTDAQMPYLSPSSITCSLGTDAAGTCTGTTAGEDTVILTFNDADAQKFLPNNKYILYLWINDPLTDKQNYTSLCIKLNEVPPGSPITGTIDQSASWPTQSPVTQSPVSRGFSVMPPLLNFTGGWSTGAQEILSNGYLSWSPGAQGAGFAGAIVIPNFVNIPGKQYVVVFSAYMINGNSLVTNFNWQTPKMIVSGTTKTTYIATITPYQLEGIFIQLGPPNGLASTIGIKLLDIRQIT